jgi:hypothetical protein
MKKIISVYFSKNTPCDEFIEADCRREDVN